MLLSDLNFGVIFKQKQTNITAGNTELIAWIEIFVQVGKLYSIAWVTIAPTEEPKRFVSTTSMCVDSRPTVIIYDLSKHYEEGSFAFALSKKALPFRPFNAFNPWAQLFSPIHLTAPPSVATVTLSQYEGILSGGIQHRHVCW